MFKNCLNLESIQFDRISSLEASSGMSSAESILLEEAWACFLSSRVYGWKSIKISAYLDHPFKLGSKCAELLLRQGSTLKLLKLRCGAIISSECIRQIYLMSPELVIFMGIKVIDQATVLQKISIVKQ
ncbi:hypothetical protein BGW39_000272 [Mortierella sp. 14UC]|nr:hypothetical protein BGW39_000272 [Mortierella sp. 14UC]